MRVAFAGTPEVAVRSLRAVDASGHEVVAVITRPDARQGRGRPVSASPVAEVADRLGVPVLKPSSLRDVHVADELARLDVDCCPVVAFGGLVPPELLDLPRHGWVNLHFSLLPAWRGAAPVQHAILSGDTVTGATTFRLTEGLDTGPVFGTITETIQPQDTAGALLERLAVSGAELLVATLDGIERGTLVPHEQPEHDVSLAPKLTTDDARVRWSEPAMAVDRRVRACTPSPGAWTELRGVRLGILPLAPSPAPPESTLGPGVVRVGKRAVWVGTGSFDVCLGEVRPAGRRVMPAADWARGVRLADGDTLT
jgi:methionyl-tRNA formyltransferase